MANMFLVLAENWITKESLGEARNLNWVSYNGKTKVFG